MEHNQLTDVIINHRKILNSLAEVGFREFKTCEYIKKHLESINIKYDVYLETAIVGKICANKGGKTIAFRADMDGLESNDKVVHICGHDGHMSILLGLLEYINKHKEDLVDDIVFIFQPAEETPGGAKPLIDQKIFDTYNIDEIYGLHIYPEVEQGKIGIKPNYFLAQNGELDITVIGKSGHGAMPQNGIDAVLIASNLVCALQSIVSRNITPFESAVVSVGYINGGIKRNVIADKAVMSATIRAFKPDVYESIKNRIYDICKGFEVSYNCKINVDIKDDYPAVNNDEILYDEFVNAIGMENIEILNPLMISEDFAYYQKVVPGIFFMLGSRNEKKGYVNGLHNDRFNYDDDVLINGLYAYIKLLKYKGALKINEK